jgi:hypothetical protein
MSNLYGIINQLNGIYIDKCTESSTRKKKAFDEGITDKECTFYPKLD